MILRQSLNFAVHLAGGVAFGALAVVALAALSRRPGAISPARDKPVETGGVASEV